MDRSGRAVGDREAADPAIEAAAAGRQGETGGKHAGPSPVDRGRPESKMHVPSEANGLPLLVGISDNLGRSAILPPNGVRFSQG